MHKCMEKKHDANIYKPGHMFSKNVQMLGLSIEYLLIAFLPWHLVNFREDWFAMHQRTVIYF